MSHFGFLVEKLGTEGAIDSRRPYVLISGPYLTES